VDGPNVTPLGTGVIVGSAVGGALALLTLIAIVVYLVYARKAALEEKEGRRKYKVLYE